ncbi:MAG: rod shape-determining protein MreC [Prevotella sp.]|nr:rod shape-determining protein MreC [Prevotella sp.]
MKNLLAFLAKYHHWLLFVVLEIVSLVLLFRFNSYQGSVWFTTANAAAGKFYEGYSEVEAFFGLTKLNEQLTQRNLYLEKQVSQMAEQLTDLTRDSAYLHQNQLQLLSEYKLIPAKVVTNSLHKRNNLITLDKGRADGVHEDMGVACGNGVVGIVYMASEHYSIVIPVINTESNISVTIKDKGYFGHVTWNGGASDMAFVDDIPRHAKFRLGADIVTSGFSSIFPAGIKVGKILHVFNSTDGLSYRIQIKLSTDFSRLRDVCIIDDSKMQERMQLMRAAKDSLKVKDEE